MLKRPAALALVLLLLALAVAACGASPTALPAPTHTPGSVPTDTPTNMPVPPTETPVRPTDTPPPPTDTPPPPTDTPLPPTPTPIAGLPLSGEPFYNQAAGYQIRIPDGWAHYEEPELGGDIFYTEGEAIEAIVQDGAIPNEPVVLVIASNLASAYYGALADTGDAGEILEILTAAVMEDATEIGEVASMPLAGETAAVQEFQWLEGEVPMTSRYLALHLGDRMLAVLGAGTTESWPAFVPTLEAMVDSLEILEPQAMPDEALRVETARYSLDLPEGWQFVDAGDGNVLIYASDDVVSELMRGEIPSFPIVAISSGPMATVADGAVASASSAQGMIDVIIEGLSGEGEKFQTSETMDTQIDGVEAATVGFSWIDEETVVVGNVLAVHLGDWGLVIQTAGQEASWDDFLPDYVSILDNLTLLEAPALELDFGDPASVLQAVFDAAQSEDPSALPYLCDPLGESDGDAAMICELTAEHEDWEGFVVFFAPGKMVGEPIVNGDRATIDFVFGPDGDQEETMDLIRRDDKWYLLGF